MKTPTAYLLVALLGATSVIAECVEGTRQTISPGFIVEHKCDLYRAGGAAIKGVVSEAECAERARDEGAEASTYHAASRQCIIAKEGGKDTKYTGAVLLVKVEEEVKDPFAPEDDIDPFAEACELAKEALQSELNKCNADLKLAKETAAVRPTSCGIDKRSTKYYQSYGFKNIAECKAYCNADARCLSFSATNIPRSTCFLYEKVAADLPHGTTAGFKTWDKGCA